MTTPGQKLGIQETGGNYFKLGVGRPSAHTDYSMDRLVAGYASFPEFTLSPDGTAIQFRAQMNAKTTSTNTKYPRSELRELDRFKLFAEWNAKTDAHIMQFETRVTHVPPVKPWVCVGQIHNGKSDLIRVQTEGSVDALTLVARWTPPGSIAEKKQTIESRYVLGTKFALRFEVTDGIGRLYYNGVLVVTFPADSTGCYFKCGAYAQSNATIDAPTEYVSTEITAGSLVVWHTGYPGSPPGILPAPADPAPEPALPPEQAEEALLDGLLSNASPQPAQPPERLSWFRRLLAWLRVY